MSEHGRIGILLPDDGPDYEWHGLNERIPGLPEVSVGRIESRGLHEVASLRALGRVQRLLPQAQALVREGCGALVWACTSASFIGGRQWALEQSEALARQAGVAASSTALAFRDALTAGGWTEIDLLSPYPEAITRYFAAFLNDSGIRIVQARSLGNRYAKHSHEMNLLEAMRNFRGRARPLVMPDTAVNTLGRWRALAEAAAPATLITANQVTLWKALSLLDWPRPWPACLGALHALA